MTTNPKTAIKIDAYFEKPSAWKKGMIRLREIVKCTELKEDFKWNFPVYTVNGKNVIGLGRTKKYMGIWFFQGVFLKDKAGLLINAQEGKTKALRQLRFTSEGDIDESLLLSYLEEAIQNQKEGKEIKPVRNTSAVIVPDELLAAFLETKQLKIAFEALSLSKQREYAEHIGSAKQETTRLRRLQKCVPMINEGVGLHDKYKNC